MGEADTERAEPLKKAAWSPQPGPQSDGISATWCEELLYGGAKFGGKSDFLLGDYLQDVQRYGKHWQGVLFRQSYPELEEIILRSHDIYPLTGATWLEQKKMWVWKNGARLRMRFVENLKDIGLYQGHSYTWIGIDEMGQWDDLEIYKRMRSLLRWAKATIPTKRIRVSANPGGPGHHIVKALFIDHAPLGYVPITDPDTGMTRMYIPARVSDNKIGLRNDPGYVGRLKGSGSPAIVKAWLEGDWNIIAGAYFPEFGQAHIVEPFSVPKHWPKFRSMDYGSARPTAIYWWCVSDGVTEVGHDGRVFPRNAMIAYREWYISSAPNVGIKMSIKDIADGIKFREMGETIDYGVIDPSTAKEEGGPSILETLRANEVYFRKADNSESGAQQFRDRLIGEDDKPMIYWFAPCVHAIRTIPALQHDDRKMERVDTDGEDHAYDSCRYAAMSRPYTRPKPHVYTGPKPNKLTWDTTFGHHLSKAKTGKSWR